MELTSLTRKRTSSPGALAITYQALMSGPSWPQGYFKMINFYSNPDVKFKGVPTGVKGAANAARVIRENRFAIAAIGDESEECGSSSSSADDEYDYGTVGRGGFFAK